MGDVETDLRTAADHWSRQTTRPGAPLTRWWQHPQIVAHINRTICGAAVDGAAGGDIELLRAHLDGRALATGVSIGCGTGVKEMALLEAGIVERFVLHEIAEARVVEGQRLAGERGLGDRVRWRRDALDFAGEPDDGGYDLVYWNNALHHMTDTPAAVAWSRRVLRPDGVFYLNDFVGPDRMQWPDAMLAAASRLRALLPDRLLVHPQAPSLRLPTTLTRPDADALIAHDPTECADSARILDAVRRTFPHAAIKLTGGVIYHLALNDVLGNIGPGDEPIVAECLMLDDRLTEAGLTHYAVAIAAAA